MMHMGMSMHQYLECTACGQNMQDHATDCPQLQLEHISKRKLWDCPSCASKFCVESNKDDFLECRNCHDVFSRSAACGYDADKLPRMMILDYDVNDTIPVVLLPAKGNGQYHVDACIAKLVKRRDDARKARAT